MTYDYWCCWFGKCQVDVEMFCALVNNNNIVFICNDDIVGAVDISSLLSS